MIQYVQEIYYNDPRQFEHHQQVFRQNLLEPNQKNKNFIEIKKQYFLLHVLSVLNFDKQLHSIEL